MKMTSKQLRGNHFVAAPLCHTLINCGAGKYSGNGRKLGKGHASYPAFGPARLADARSESSSIAADALKITHDNGVEAELKELRYHLERNVELRTRQLTKRIALLETCNTALSEKLALTIRELTSLKQQPTENTIRKDQAAKSILTTQAFDCDGKMHGIGDWANNMIGERVAAAGAIS